MHGYAYSLGLFYSFFMMRVTVCQFESNADRPTTTLNYINDLVHERYSKKCEINTKNVRHLTKCATFEGHFLIFW